MNLRPVVTLPSAALEKLKARHTLTVLFVMGKYVASLGRWRGEGDTAQDAIANLELNILASEA